MYKDVTFSSNPSSQSYDDDNNTGLQYSFFPIYLPIRQPFRLKRNEDIDATFFRIVDSKKMHYEWCITSPYTTDIQNQNGTSYFISL